MPVAQADPADARGQALKLDALARHVEPAVQVRVVGEQLLHLGVGLVDVLGIARQRRPAERPDAAAEQRPDIGRHEAREVEGVRASPRPRRPGGCCCRSRPSECPASWKSSMAATCCRHRALGGARHRRAGSLSPRGEPLLERPALRQVAVDRIVRGGLVGDESGRDACAAPARDRRRRRCRAGRPRPARLLEVRDRSASASSRRVGLRSR